MAATVFIRGNTLYFSAACLDATGNPVTPNSANLYLVYTDLVTGARTRVTVAMTVVGNIISATWDSSAAANASLHWSIRAVGANNIVQDGEITLTGNEANPTS